MNFICFIKAMGAIFSFGQHKKTYIVTDISASETSKDFYYFIKAPRASFSY